MRFIAGICGLLVLLAGPVVAAEKVTVAMVRAGLSAPTLLAIESGAFAAEGLDVTIAPLNSSTAVALAVASDDAQIGITAFSAAVFNLAGKGAIRIIGGSTREEPGYRNLAYVATAAAFEAGLRRPQDLAGRSIGISTVGSPTHYALGILAQKYGLDLGGMRLVPLQTIPATAAALQGGQIEATLLPAAMAEKAVRDGNGRIVGWVAEETPHQFGGLFAAARTIRERRSLIARYMRGHRAGGRLFFEAFLRRDAAGRPIKGENYDRFVGLLAERQGIDRRLVEATITYNDPDARLNVRSLFEQIRFWQAQGLVDTPVDPRQVVDLSFVDGHLDVPMN